MPAQGDRSPTVKPRAVGNLYGLERGQKGRWGVSPHIVVSLVVFVLCPIQRGLLCSLFSFSDPLPCTNADITHSQHTQAFMLK